MVDFWSKLTDPWSAVFGCFIFILSFFWLTEFVYLLLLDQVSPRVPLSPLIVSERNLDIHLKQTFSLSIVEIIWFTLKWILLHCRHGWKSFTKVNSWYVGWLVGKELSFPSFSNFFLIKSCVCIHRLEDCGQRDDLSARNYWIFCVGQRKWKITAVS